MGAPRLTLLLPFVLLAGGVHAAPRGSIEATIRGTDQPLEIELLRRNGDDHWTTITHRRLGQKRRVRFEDLEGAVYQLLVRGRTATEQLATKIVLGGNDRRSVAIAIEPIELTGHVTYGGTPINGALRLHHQEFHWSGRIDVAGDGSFRAPLWQRGAFTFEVRGPGLTTPFHDALAITGTMDIAVDIPDGRIRGIVRETRSGLPVAKASVVLEGESMTRLATDAAGRFDFTGMWAGKYSVRVVSPLHLQAEPVVVRLDSAARQRDLEITLDRGRTLSVDVFGAEQSPVANAVVFVLAGARLCSRTLTHADGRTNVAAPADEASTLFVVSRSGSFRIQRVERTDDAHLRVDLPPATSSLLVQARTTSGAKMPPFSLLMRFNGTIVPPEVADELPFVLSTGEEGVIRLQGIPVGSYEFWPYRTSEEAEAILASADALAAPIRVDVRAGENNVAVKFAPR